MHTVIWVSEDHRRDPGRAVCRGQGRREPRRSDAAAARLRESIRQHSKRKPKFRLKDGSVGGGWMQRDYTWEEIMEMCYEGRGGRP